MHAVRFARPASAARSASGTRAPLVLATGAVWALAAASAVYWGLRLASPAPQPALPPVAAAPAPVADPAVLGRLLGATDAPVAAAPASTRFVLQGVIASASGGTALIAADGQPARAYRVGATVADGLTLQSVGVRSAVLGAGPDAPASLSLALPGAAAAP